jgi:3'-phosphoadenosine 5'-phosphosulfate (PAPS) 3'-phosphatase
VTGSDENETNLHGKKVLLGSLISTRRIEPCTPARPFGEYLVSTHPLVNIGIRAARRASTVILRGMNHLDSLEVSAKGRNDFVSDIDRSAEAEIIETIRRAYPDHGFLAEESGLSVGRDEVTWIIDPLDGTTNYLHGFPQFCISIAVQIRGRVEHRHHLRPYASGVVYGLARRWCQTGRSSHSGQQEPRPRGRSGRNRPSLPLEYSLRRTLDLNMLKAVIFEYGWRKTPRLSRVGPRLCGRWPHRCILGTGP